MIEYSAYQNYINHNRTFNVLITTTFAILFSVLIGILLYNIGFINSDWGILAILLLVSIPAVTFIRELSKYEGVIAYHYTWADAYHGLRDRALIAEDYGKKHNISSWKTYLSENKPDGRWNYHVDTKYMDKLAMSRNNILIEIAKEYTETRASLVKTAKDIKSQSDKAREDLVAINARIANVDSLRKITPPGATQYDLDCRKKILSSRKNTIREVILELDIAMHAAEEDIKKHDYAFIAQKNRIAEDYKIRSDKYTRIATKAIRKHGLKFEIAGLKLPNQWINNPIERSII